MFILRIGAHQKRQNILKLHLFYVTMSCRDELTFPAFRKGATCFIREVTAQRRFIGLGARVISSIGIRIPLRFLGVRG